MNSNEQGFTLVELLIAMAISGVVLGAVVTAFSTQRKAYDLQENLTEMVLNARVGMEMITREARVAGYDPSGAGFDAMPYQSTTLQIQADLNGDGDIVDDGETILYSHDTSLNQMQRQVNPLGSGAIEVLAENIESLTFDYLDANGTATTTTADIRQVRVTITARTPEPDPQYTSNGGYRTYTLSSLVLSGRPGTVPVARAGGASGPEGCEERRFPHGLDPRACGALRQPAQRNVG